MEVFIYMGLIWLIVFLPFLFLLKLPPASNITLSIGLGLFAFTTILSIYTLSLLDGFDCNLGCGLGVAIVFVFVIPFFLLSVVMSARCINARIQ